MVARFPIEAETARLTIGKLDVHQKVPAGAASVTFEVRLEVGQTRLQTWLTQKSGKSKGAYFVEVKFLSDN